MSNEWNVTESEYQTALERSRNDATPESDSADYWQLVRFYRGQIFYRDHAERALRRIRADAEELERALDSIRDAIAYTA